MELGIDPFAEEVGIENDVGHIIKNMGKGKKIRAGLPVMFAERRSLASAHGLQRVR